MERGKRGVDGGEDGRCASGSVFICVTKGAISEISIPLAGLLGISQLYSDSRGRQDRVVVVL